MMVPISIIAVSLVSSPSTKSDGTLEELFFSTPDYEEIRLCEEPKVHEYWEAGLTMESVDALWLGRWDHTRSMCYHCKNRSHLKANCPDRRLANRRPWEKTWKTRSKGKRCQGEGGGKAKQPPPNLNTQEVE